MTRPFQYDNFVQSQIAMGPGYQSVNFGSNVRKNQEQIRSRNALETSNGNQSRNSLKLKINELLGLCKQENQGMKTNFKQVIGAEKQILNLMREEIDQPPRFNNYARSNVQMFPGPNQTIPGVPTHQNQGYDEDQRQRGYQSFPNYKNVPNTGNYQQSQPNYQNQQYQQQRYQQPVYHAQQTYNPQPNYNQQPYVTDYTTTVPQPGYGPQTNDRANILRSKVLELKDENNRLKNIANQNQGYNDDQEIRQLQQQVHRLKNVVQNYEQQLASLSSSPKNANQRNYLRQLLDQGERIRQDTITLLKAKSTPNGGYSNGFAGNANYGDGVGVVGGYGSYNEYAAGGRKGSQGLSSEQQAFLRSQLNQLRMECEQLHQENANIKRTSKGRY